MNEYVFQPLKRLFSQPAFVICTAFLAICAGGLKVAAQKMQWHLRKEPIYLKKPLDQLDKTRLAPYRFVRSDKIPDDILAELGTEEYIQWALDDQSVDRSDPLRFVSLFVTYYTGDPDMVTHTPDVCYVGSGGEITDRRNTEIRVPGCGLQDDRLLVRILTVSLPGDFGRQERFVLYFFAVNGRYDCRRERLRLILNNVHDKYSYFSKVEFSFPKASAVNRERALAATEKMLRKLMPILVSDHWPTWPPVDQKKSQ